MVGITPLRTPAENRILRRTFVTRRIILPSIAKNKAFNHIEHEVIHLTISKPCQTMYYLFHKNGEARKLKVQLKIMAKA